MYNYIITHLIIKYFLYIKYIIYYLLTGQPVNKNLTKLEFYIILKLKI